MLPIKENTIEALKKLEEFIGTTPWKDTYLNQIRAMGFQITEPCTLAVAGRVKVGKSSFINALLEDDLALVGNTETTATINVFRYGDPPFPEKPVKCTLQNGRITWESRAFLDSLQGHSVEVLQRAADIKFLEFYVKSPLLANNIRLVDTPGIGAYVPEDIHEKRTSDYFKLNETLRNRHTSETIALSADADAVIYLTDHVIQACDADFLGKFQEKSRAGGNAGTAINILGIIAQADRSSKLMGTVDEKKEFIRTEGGLLAEQLEIPVQVLSISAGLQRALERFPEEYLSRLQNQLHNGFSPAAFDLAITGNDREFCDDDLPTSLSAAERMEILRTFSGTPWSVLKIILSVLFQSENIAGAVSELNGKSGFPALLEVLEKHFFARGEMLRCHTVITTVLRFLFELKNCIIYQYDEQIRNDQKDYPDFLDFIFSHPDFPSNPAGKKLQLFLERAIPESSPIKELVPKLDELTDEFLSIKNVLDYDKDNFEGLLFIENNPSCVTEEEMKELWELFEARTTLDRATVCGRELYWRAARQYATSSARRMLCELAEKQYQRKNR